MPEKMTDEQRRAFLAEGTRTAVFATVRPDGRPHAVPVWFAVDGDDILVNLGADTVKGRALKENPRVSVVVDDPLPPYSFVSVEGVAEIVTDPEEIRRGSRPIAERYLGDAGQETIDGWLAYATSPGKVLVRVRPENIVAIAKVGG
ncbi:PPOX class F420-dependent oxidoreductase [Amycolatopsis regifaucium]|uniref:F420-dependent protein n=1 Tax=Amycolatopsis regifaucium TaxID=546365 RepID=A0A154MXK8_9PSEU|nr:PPOX class F420-dependent oxidoreductase [Amycolatopsis regifaucium]KZB88693.1 F420-dependent protein [Amycolatopsis regifaucium]OKA07135.1 PPOX class F420-dependent enzyme [Amycolatopsis regifaucium]SFI57074.1 Pyridoxamine 5'-phosphate oxidase [Amycolatopsis regifaucium]